MNVFEKIKLTNGSIYEIVPGGLWENSDRTKLTIIARMGNRSLTEVDTETDNPANVSVITVLDVSGDEMDIKKGYRYQVACKKQKDYAIGSEEIDTGRVDETGKPITESKEMLETVVAVELATGDVRAELEEAKSEIANLSETVDMLVIGALEG